MAMLAAIWIDCPGVANEGRAAHAMRDRCFNCAPFWERMPTCPHCGRKLHKTGRTKCRRCQEWVLVGDDSGLTPPSANGPA